MKRKKAKRPKWAAKLDAQDWKHLKESQQSRRVPSLRAFKADREWQKENGEPCVHCRVIDNRLTLNKG